MPTPKKTDTDDTDTDATDETSETVDRDAAKGLIREVLDEWMADNKPKPSRTATSRGTGTSPSILNQIFGR